MTGEKKKCPDCGEVLHQIEDDAYGCDNCKQTYTVEELTESPKHTPGRYGREEHGDELPETIL